METDYEKELRYPVNGYALPFEMYVWIRENIEEGSTILELGSGSGSTGNLSQFYKMYSVENNKEYIGKYNSTYIYAPLRNKWFDIQAIKNGIEDIKYDALIIDGPSGSSSRTMFLQHMTLFDISVPLIFDDTHRQPEKNMALQVANQLKRGVYIKNCYDELSGTKEHGFAAIL